MQQSMNFLEGTLSFELASRFLTAYIANHNFNCTYYLNKVGTLDAAPARVAAICALYPFDNLDSVKTFLGGLIYPNGP